MFFSTIYQRKSAIGSFLLVDTLIEFLDVSAKIALSRRCDDMNFLILCNPGCKS